MDFYNIVITICVYAIPVIFAITLHEAAHGYVARHFGDNTAWMLGRVTLNPAKHIDPVGTVVLPLVTLALTHFMFGWAKPVPVNFNNLRNPRWHGIWVAAAGPASNVVQALIWALVLRVLAETVAPNGLVGSFWMAIAEKGVVINVVFAVLNLVPILPLDGGRIVASLLPPRVSYSYSRLEPYGLVILLVLMATGLFSRLLGPPVELAANGIFSLFGLL
ncbi:MAG TPA: site-2 protease family protein [Usitatibacter sp.]|jgi:Zn-dependent protease|nr:site-2 protease family protein [Usitatibacter sp.]